MRQIASHRTRARIIALAGAALVCGTSVAVVAPAAAAPQADPQARGWEAAPRPVAPQVPGYRISGYNLGSGNYQGTIDPQTGKLWVTNVSPMSKPTQSSLLRVDPRTMRLEKRIRVTARSPKNPKLVNAQFGIGINGNQIWTTGSQDNTVSVFDKTTGTRLKQFSGTDHSHSVKFVPSLGIALVSVSNPAGLAVFDTSTLAPLGRIVLPSPGPSDLAVGFDVTDATATGATVTVASYKSAVTQFRVTRSGRKVSGKVTFRTPQVGTGHGAVLADTRRNRFYVTDLYNGTVSEYNLRTGARTRAIVTGPGPSTLAHDSRRGIVYVTNYFGGFLSTIDQRTGGVSSLMTTGLLPNQVLMWGDTAMVIDKSSTISQGGYLLNNGVDHVWKITPAR